MKNKTVKVLLLSLFFLSFCVLFLCIKNYSTHVKAVTACRIWDDFVANIKAKNYTKVNILLLNEHDFNTYSPIQSYLRFENDKIFYYQTDVTSLLEKSKSRYFPTLDYYLISKNNAIYDKVIFEGGFALISNSKIFYIKIP